MTAAILNDFGTYPFANDWLIILVIKGPRMSKHSLTRLVGIGSTDEDLGEHCLMSLVTSSSVTGLKSTKQSPVKSGSGAIGTLSSLSSARPLCMSLILSEKNDAILSHSSSFDSWVGSAVAFFLPNNSSVILNKAL